MAVYKRSNRRIDKRVTSVITGNLREGLLVRQYAYLAWRERKG